MPPGDDSRTGYAGAAEFTVVRDAAGDIEAITTMAALADHLEDATRQAITALNAFGYSWADIGMRLGITRQGAQQRWGTHTPDPVITPDGTPNHRSRP